MHGKKTFQKSVILENVTIGSIKLSDVNANVFQHVAPCNVPTLVLGRVFLKRYHAIVDLSQKKLYLDYKKLSQLAMNKIQNTLLRQQSRAVPLLSLGSGSMVIPVQINHLTPVLFLFDTGTGITLLSQAYAKIQHLKQAQNTKEILITKLTMNPLNLSFQPKVSLSKISAQPANLTMLRKYLYVQGIFGLSDMIKAHTIIFSNEGAVYLRSH